MNDVRDMTGLPGDVPGLLGYWAGLAPDRACLVLDDRDAITYADLDRLSSCLAGELLRVFGNRTDETVVCAFAPAEWVEFAIAYIAVQKSGNTPVIMRHSMAADEYKAVMLATSSEHMICGPGGLPRVNAALAELRVSRAEVNDLALPESELPGAREIADILFSSGTGGLPEPVPARHSDIIPGIDGRYGELHLDAREGRAHSKLILYPIGTMGARLSFASNIFVGGTAIVLSQFRPTVVVDVIERYRLRDITLVPPWALRLAEHVASKGGLDRLRSLRRIMISGSKTPASTIELLSETFPGVRLLNVYGATETGRAFITGPLNSANDRTGKIGRPEAGVRVRAVDSAGRVLPPGEPGRLQIATSGTDTADAGDTEPGAVRAMRWVNTGDIGYIDEDGAMFLVDREKDIVIVGGLNVSSLEVENVLREHPAVRDVAVIGVPDRILGECVVAVVVPCGTITERQLKIVARKRLANYKVPSHIVFESELPVNHLGKVLKRSLRERLTAGALFRGTPSLKTDARDDSPAS